VIDLSSVFLLAFLVSMGLTVATLVLGIVDLPFHGDHGPGDVGADVAHAGDVAHPGDVDVGHGVSPPNTVTILGFATWFSGTGYILTGPLGIAPLIALAIALVAGLVGAGIVFFILVHVFLRGQTPYLRAQDFDPVGTIGRLSVGIRAGGTGELVFSRGGARQVATARSASDEPIERGTEVVVVRHERGVSYVEPFTDLLNDP
jgi:hypothetical protein